MDKTTILFSDFLPKHQTVISQELSQSLQLFKINLQSEIEKMTGVVEEVNRKSRDLYMVGEEVTVKNGPFSNFKGKIQIIDFEKDKVKLEVFIFGRSTIIDLTTDDISK